MTIFDFVIIIYTIVIVFGNKSKKDKVIDSFVLNLICIIYIELGYAINLGSSGFGYGVFTTIITAIFCICYVLNQKKISRKIFYIGSAFLISISIGVILLSVNPYSEPVLGIATSWDSYIVGIGNKIIPSLNGTNISYLMRSVVFTIVIITVYSFFTKEDWKKLICKVAIGSKVFLLYGIFEVFLTDILNINSYNVVTKAILGKDLTFTAADSLYLRGNLYQLQGLTKEPSHYVYTLFLTVLILVVDKKLNERKNINKWIIITCILMILSGSFSSIFLLAGLLIYYLLYLRLLRGSKNRSRLYLFLLIFFMIIIGVSIFSYLFFSSNSYLGTRLNDLVIYVNLLIHGNLLSSVSNITDSSVVRLTSIYDTWKIFLDRPLFGIGIGTTTCHSFTISLFATCGIFGVFIWLKMIFFSAKFGFMKTKYYFFALAVWLILGLGVSHDVITYTENVILMLFFNCIYGKEKLNEEDN